VPTILVVDFRTQILALAKAILERHSYDVITAESGEQALRVLDANRVDLVLAEVLMPHMSGLDLIERVKQSGNVAPFLLMTGYTDRPLDSNIDVLRKPFTPDQLVHAAEAALGCRQALTAAAAR
jgi:DNA-binding NtrC family response regulator